VAEGRAVSRLKQGDIGGLQALVRLHGQQAVRLAALITRDGQAAEDVVSSSFIVAYERIHQFDGRRPFWPWFRRIVANTALKALGREGRFTSLDDLEETMLSVDLALYSASTASSDPAQQLEASLAQQEVRRALASLTPKQRAVTVLRYFAGMSETEIAESLNVPGGTVKSRASAALGRLRRLLAHLNGAPDRARDRPASGSEGRDRRDRRGRGQT
jgi:RNA polymerase sigma-70 factor (ECF subfamily)